MGPRTIAQPLLYDPSDPGMFRIPGGTFWKGSDRHYPEGEPIHRVTVNSFWIDGAPVMNWEFRRPIVATRYIAVAEKVPGLNDQLHDQQCGSAQPGLLFGHRQQRSERDHYKLRRVGGRRRGCR